MNSTPTITSSQSILQSIFGYASFRPPQDKIIQTVVEGGDALVLMPTGGGKSLCYQIPALCMDGTAIVISPLIALMQDQVKALKAKGIHAAAISSALSAAERRWAPQRHIVFEVQSQLAPDLLVILYREVIRSIELASGPKLVYVTPETLVTEAFMSILHKVEAAGRLALFAVGEWSGGGGVPF